MQHGQDAGVAQQHFVHAARGRVAMKRRHHIVVEQAAQAGQRSGKVLHDMHRPLVQIRPLARLVTGLIVKLQLDLGQQGVQRAVQGVANVKIFAFFAQIGRAQPHGKQRAAHGVDNLGQRLARGQLAPAGLASAPLALAPAHARHAQPRHHIGQRPLAAKHFRGRAQPGAHAVIHGNSPYGCDGCRLSPAPTAAPSDASRRCRRDVAGCPGRLQSLPARCTPR